MTKNKIKEKLLNDIIIYKNKYKNEKSKYQKHYYQGKIDYINQIILYFEEKQPSYEYCPYIELPKKFKRLCNTPLECESCIYGNCKNKKELKQAFLKWQEDIKNI